MSHPKPVSNRRRLPAILAGPIFALSTFSVLEAAPFIPGDLVIYRVGDGTNLPIAGSANPVFLDERSPVGALVQSIALPTTGADAVTANRGATAEGLLQRSADGTLITVPGYSADVGTATVTSSTVPRTVALIGPSGSISGTIDLTASTVNPYSGGTLRSVATVDGTGFWSSGVNGTNPGAQYFDGTGNSTQLNPTVTTLRAADIFGGQLYVSSSTPSFVGINAIGNGLPTSADQQVALVIPTGGSPYQFQLADLSPTIAGLDTAWIADDRTAANGGGIQRWNFDGTAWTLAYTINSFGTGTRGLAVDLSTPVPIIYATTTEPAFNRFISVADVGAASTFTVLATAGANEAYRGLDFVPVPEPAAFAALIGGTAFLGVIWRRRR